MGNNEKNEERKRYNEPFLRAFKYLKESLGLNQGQLCKIINTPSSHMAAYANGTKKVSGDIMLRLANTFTTKLKEPLNMYYLEGRNQYMLVRNVPDEEVMEYTFLDDPDYQVKKQQQQKAAEPQTGNFTATDNMLDLYAQMIRGIDDLRVQLAQELSEIKTIKAELQHARNAFTEATNHLNYIINNNSYSYGSIAAEDLNPQKK